MTKYVGQLVGSLDFLNEHWNRRSWFPLDFGSPELFSSAASRPTSSAQTVVLPLNVQKIFMFPTRCGVMLIFGLSSQYNTEPLAWL